MGSWDLALENESPGSVPARRDVFVCLGLTRDEGPALVSLESDALSLGLGFPVPRDE